MARFNTICINYVRLTSNFMHNLKHPHLWSRKPNLKMLIKINDRYELEYQIKKI